MNQLSVVNPQLAIAIVQTNNRKLERELAKTQKDNEQHRLALESTAQELTKEMSKLSKVLVDSQSKAKQLEEAHKHEVKAYKGALRESEKKCQALMIQIQVSKKANLNDGTFLLHAVIRFGLIPEVDLLIKKGININDKNQEGDTPLHIALKNYEDEKILQILLKNGANYNTQDTMGNSPLHLAIQLEDLTPLLLLLTLPNINFFSKNESKQSPYKLATDLEKSEAATLIGEFTFFERGKNVPFKELKYYVAVEYYDVLMFAIKNGYDVNTYCKEDDDYLLSWTSSSEMVQFLIKQGAKINQVNSKGETVLHMKAKYAENCPIQALLDAGADPSIADKQGKLPLHSAAKTSYNCVKCLLKHSPDTVNTKDKEGLDALKIACFHNRPYTASILLDSGADPMQVSNQYHSAFHAAMVSKSYKCLEVLAEKRDINARLKSNGKTPLHLALEPKEGCPEMIKKLLSLGADPYISDNSGKMPLHLTEDPECRKLLAESMKNKLDAILKENNHARDN